MDKKYGYRASLLAAALVIAAGASEHSVAALERPPPTADLGKPVGTGNLGKSETPKTATPTLHEVSLASPGPNQSLSNLYNTIENGSEKWPTSTVQHLTGTPLPGAPGGGGGGGNNNFPPGFLSNIL